MPSGWKNLAIILFLVLGLTACAARQQQSSSPEPTIAAAPANQPAEASKQQTVTVRASHLNVRAKASSKSPVLGVVKKNDVLNVLGEKGKWIKVKTPTKIQGWVFEKYVAWGEMRSKTVVKTDVKKGKAPDITPQKKPLPKTPQSVHVKTSHTPPLEDSSKTALKSQPEKPDKTYFVKLYTDVRNAIAKGDLNTFQKLAQPAGNTPEKIKPEDFAEMKEFLIMMFPDIAKGKFLNFDSDEKSAILVYQTEMETAEYIHLSAFKFISTEKGWLLSGEMDNKTFPSQGHEKDPINIKKEIKENPLFQLASVGKDTAPQMSADPSPPEPDPVPKKAGLSDGRLVFNGETIPLKHAYATTEPGAFDKTKDDIVVILSDIPLSQKAVLDWGERYDLEKKGQLHCVELRINTDRKIISRTVRHSAMEGASSGFSTSEVFVPAEIDPDKISGSVTCQDPIEFFEHKFQYSASFNAKIINKPIEKTGADIKSNTGEPDYDRTQFDKFPEHKAIEKMLLKEGEYEILKTTAAIAVSGRENYARGTISCMKNDIKTKVEVYLFKEEGSWVAYLDLPTHKDHMGVFDTLAQKYFKVKAPNFQGISYLDDSWKSKDPKQRTINYNCGELVDNQWKYHHFGLVFEYDQKTGWHILKDIPLEKEDPKQTETTTKSTESSEKPDTGKQLTNTEKFPLHYAALRARGPEAEAYALKLIADGMDVNQQDNAGRTPLIMLCHVCPSARVAQALVDAGADVNIKTNGGNTALWQLRDRGGECAKIREILIKAGAK